MSDVSGISAVAFSASPPTDQAAFDARWLNAFVALAHRLIETPEPFMLTRLVENDAGQAVR